MAIFIFGNNSSSTLASGITNVATSATVQAGQGTLFPVPSAGQQVAITLEDVSGNIEVTYCTGVTGDVLTLVRAQEGTAALAFASGSRVEARVTKGMLNALLQKNGGDTLSGTTTLNGTLTVGGGGSIQGGEYALGHVRGNPGETDNQFTVPAGGGAPTIGTSVVVTNANMVAQVPSGYSLAQTNMVVMWAGSSGSVPAGWHLCDGTSGTPDLRDRFVVGAGTTYALNATGGSAATTTGSTDPSGSMTVAGHVLTIAELPAHHHQFFSGVAASGNSVGKCPDWGAGGAFNDNITSGPYSGQQIIQDTGSGTAHTHSLSGGLAHTHTITLPPYYGLFFIMKL